MGLNSTLKNPLSQDKGFFCEVYGRSPTLQFDKGLMFVLQALNSLRGNTIYQRKTLWASSYDMLQRATPWFDIPDQGVLEELGCKSFSLAKEIIGWEFNNFEWTLPYQLGGWRIFRDEDGKPSLYQWLLENNVPPEFMRLATDKESNITSKSFVINNLLSEIRASPYMNDVLDSLEWANPHFKEIIEGKFKRMSWDKLDKRKQDASFLHQVQQKRFKAFKSQRSICHSELVKYLYLEGNFRELPNDPCLLVHRGVRNCPIWVDHTPYKGIRIDPLRASRLAFCRMNNYPTEIKYSKDLTFRELIANIYPWVSTSRCAIPYDWFVWCNENNVDIGRYYTKMKEDYGLILFDYFPPYMEGMSRIPSYYDDIQVYWDDDFGSLFLINPSECSILSTGNKFAKDKCISDKLNIDIEVYYLKCEYRNPLIIEESDEPFELSEEDKQWFIDNQQGEEPKLNAIELGALRHEAITDLSQLQDLDFEDEYYSEDEETHSRAYSNEWDEMFASEDLDSIDLLGFYALDDWDNG